MTDVATDESTETGQDGASGRRGRPRSQETLTRDAVVLDAVNGAQDGLTKAEIVEKTGLTANAVYLSIFRLNRDSQITKSAVTGRGFVWHVPSRVPTASATAESTDGSEAEVDAD